MDRDAFELAKRKILRDERKFQGVGTLSEKTLHAILKLYYSPNEDFHEVAIEGYFADIYNGDEIIEIQTQNLGKLRPKLDTFLKEYKVKVIYPLVRSKYIISIDPDTGEHSKRRKSPQKATIYDAFYEIFRVQDYIKNPNLSIHILFLDVEEYRLKDQITRRGRKKAVRYDRIPLEVVEEYIFERIEDYRMLIPYDLPEEFTSTDFAKAAKIYVNTARLVLNLFARQNIVSKVGKKGNNILYKVIDAI